MAAANVLFSFRNFGIVSKLNKNALSKVFGVRKSSKLSYHDALNIPDPRITTLKNRLRIATEETASGSATVGLWIDVGSRYEKEDTSGATHLLEHLLFKGTPKRNQLSLETEVDNLGMTLDSYVCRDHMAIYAKCLSKDVPKAVEILSDMVQNNVYNESDIEKEKEVILAELEDAGSDLSGVVMDYLHATAYQGTTLGRSVWGSTASIKGLKKKDLELLKDYYITPPRIVLAGAGGVSHETLVHLGEKHFGQVVPSFADGIPIIPPSRFTGSEIRARYDDEPFAHIAMAVEGPGVVSEDNLPLQVASAIMGSWDQSVGGGKNLASHLVQASTVAGLSKCFRSFNISYHGTGLWGTYFVCDRMTIDDFMYNLQGEWMRICISATKEEVDRAKNAIRTSLFGHTGDSTLTCDDLARQALFLGRRISYEELENRLEAIDEKVVRDVAFKYIYDKCPAIVSYGPTEQVPDYNRIRSAMYWLRY